MATNLVFLLLSTFEHSRYVYFLLSPADPFVPMHTSNNHYDIQNFAIEFWAGGSHAYDQPQSKASQTGTSVMKR